MLSIYSIDKPPGDDPHIWNPPMEFPPGVLPVLESKTKSSKSFLEQRGKSVSFPWPLGSEGKTISLNISYLKELEQ